MFLPARNAKPHSAGRISATADFWAIRNPLRQWAPHVIGWAALWMLLATVQGYDFDFDILNYHFYNGYALLHGKTFTNIQPAMQQSYFAPLADAVFYVLAKQLPPMAAILVIAFFQSLSFPILFGICRETVTDVLPGRQAFWLCLVVTILGAVAPVSLWEAGSHRGDSDTVPFIVGALLLVVDALHNPACSFFIPRIAIAGALTGFAAALKLTDAAFAAGLGAASLAQAFVSAIDRRFSRTIVTFGVYWIACAASFLVFYGWWGALLYSHLGNPFFPNFNQIFRSPFAAPVSYSNPMYALPRWQDKLFFPFVRNSLFDPLNGRYLFDIRMACALPAILLAFAALPFRRPQAPSSVAGPNLAVLLFVLVSYACWLFVFPINRYLVAVDIVSPLATILAISLVWRNRVWIWVGTAVLSICLLVSAGRTLPLWWTPWTHRHGNEGGYFGVSFTPPPNLDHAIVAMLSDDRPLAFIIPFFPPTTTFVRLQGSLLYPQFMVDDDLRKRKRRMTVFGNAMGKAICRDLGNGEDRIFLLHVAPTDTPNDIAAMTYFGLADSGGKCSPISNKAGMELMLCPARRTPKPECNEKEP